MLKKITILVFCLYQAIAFSATIDEAYQALSVYDYFKAKKLFYKSLPKYPREASFGLATIFYRNDNPFSQVDSAAKYIAISWLAPVANMSKSLVSARFIDSLSRLVSLKGFDRYVSKNKIPFIEKYLKTFYFAPDSLKEIAYRQRDSSRLTELETYESSDSIRHFIAWYPESVFQSSARRIYEDAIYKEQVRSHTPSELKNFIAHFPENRNRPKVEEALFQLVKGTHQPDEVYDFIKHCSSELTGEQAWKYLYGLSVTNYSEKELQAFLIKYPDYPYKQHVEKEINLSSTVLIALKNNHDKWGYIDTLENWVILPQYDDASEFKEGLAAVCINDSCFYIDKEGKKAFASFFSETSDYAHGVAVVKQKDNYFLMNRTGQLISLPYSEMNDLADNLYVVKQRAKYGAINSKGMLVIPAVYTKLGDFKKGFAYYVSEKYGLIDTLNKVYNAQWDWISDVDPNNTVIVKRQNLFGLLKAPEQLILNTAYDYIKPCGQDVFLVVKNNLYGFYNAAEACFIANVEFDYKPQYEPDYYSTGRLFKRIRNDEVSLVDANGRVSIDYGKYEDVFFAKCDLVRVLKNQKFGFVDRKLKVVINAEYEEATDFENERAIVVKKEVTAIIDKMGKALFSCKSCEIKSFESNYLVTVNGKTGLVDANGNYILHPVYDSIETLNSRFIVARDANSLYVLSVRTKELKKL